MTKRRAKQSPTKSKTSPKPPDLRQGSEDRASEMISDILRRLRGSCKGKGSLVKGLQRERRRDDRIKSRKLEIWGRV